MSEILSLGEDDFSGTLDSHLDPFFKIIEKKNKDELHEWLVLAAEALLTQSHQRSLIQQDNLAMYRGIDRRQRNRTNDRDLNFKRLNSMKKFVVNHLHDLTETKVSQMTRLKPNVEVLPTNDEWKDRASAKVVQLIIKHLWYVNNIDGIVTKMHRDARIFGESYCFTEWNEDLGDLHPAYVQARDANMDLKALEKKGLKKNTGDIDYTITLPWRVLLQRKLQIKDSEYCFKITIQETEKLKKEYPSKKGKINPTTDLHMFDIDSLTDRFLEEHTVVFEMYNKKTKELPEQYYCKFTKEVLLENGNEETHPNKLFSHGLLPFTRLTDKDVPDTLNGVSNYEIIAPIQRMYNNLSTLIAKNIYLTAHAKWMMPRGACKIEQLGNDNTVVQYQGGLAPQMVQTQPNSPEVYAFRSQLKEEMQTIYGNHGVSRGEVPKGITAASALQFLNELESERASSDISKHSDLVISLAKATVAVVGDMYDSKDGRMVRIVGENNKFFIRHFDAAHLHKSYDIRFDLSSGLPETKSAKMQRILDAMQRAPQMLSGARWEELLELGNIEKFHSLVSEAIKAADSENEDIMAEREVQAPEEWEDHVQHWMSHAQHMQSRSFKEEASPQARNAMKDHVFWTEEAMFVKAEKNPEFSARLATLELFPIFEHKFAPPVSREQQIATVQGQANRGDDVTGQIPGSSVETIQEQEFAKNQLSGGK